MSQALRIVFAGTPEFAAEHLKALLDTPHRIVAVYTQPDRPAGRGQKLMPSAVKNLALEHGLPVMQPQSLRNAEAQAELAALRADLMVVVAYGLILPRRYSISRAWAASTATPRCCRAGAAPRRSSARWKPATRRAASP